MKREGSGVRSNREGGEGVLVYGRDGMNLIEGRESDPPLCRPSCLMHIPRYANLREKTHQTMLGTIRRGHGENTAAK